MTGITDVSIYVIAMSNDDIGEIEIAYASTMEKANEMIDIISHTDGFELNEYRFYKAPIDYIEINDMPVRV